MSVTIDQQYAVDPLHDKIDVMQQSLVADVVRDKYCTATESTHEEVIRRVCAAVYEKDHSIDARQHAEAAMCHLLWVPAGRILAGAGTGRRVTLQNCFVMGTIKDDLGCIFDHLKEAALTMQQGGGIGYDFSTLRPHGAQLVNTGTFASGPVSFMDVWDAMCRTIMSAGERRGAMMATIADWHPDLLRFIDAKREAGRLTQFNVSILVSDAFMQAVRDDGTWRLYHHKPRADGQHVEQFTDKHGVTQYVYSAHRARSLWDYILAATYENSEPGVIFIDCINKRNNLKYVETIASTNPCFAADTRIVTRQGARPISDLVDEVIDVWDGSQWRTIDNFRVTGRNQRMLKITMHDGAQLRVTSKHTMIMSDGRRVSAGELRVGDRLMLSDVEYDGPRRTEAAYLKGFLLGDGNTVKDSGRIYLGVHPPKYICKPKLIASASELAVGKIRTSAVAELSWRRDVSCGQEYDMLRGLSVRRADLLEWVTTHRDGLPADAFSWDRSTKLEFLAGYFDADGTALDTANGYGYQISAVSNALLQDVQTLLKSIGVRSHLSRMTPAGLRAMPGGQYHCQETWRLTIAQRGAVRLAEQISFERLPSFADRELKYDVKTRAGRIQSVEDDGIDEVVYCCTVPDTHSVATGIGILTAQCGEQPLPPYGACLLGAVNLARIVKAPFTRSATIDLDLLERVARVAVRFCDNVIDVSRYPLPQQRDEQQAKRRMGIGVTGLANMLQQLGVGYGTDVARNTVDYVMRRLTHAAYSASADLAVERGPFPLFDADKYLADSDTVVAHLDVKLRAKIRTNGLRNALLLTIAPTGTTSIWAGNVSSGIEPVFAHSYKRKVLQADGSHETHVVFDYGTLLFNQVDPLEIDNRILDRPQLILGAEACAMNLSVRDHITMQAACQKWIDASISKTVNIPADMSKDAFARVYDLAYDLGCKGCTTYRPSATRGSVLDLNDDVPATPADVDVFDDYDSVVRDWLEGRVPARPPILPGITYKVRMPGVEAALYVTINDHPDTGRPFEIFIATKAAQHHDRLLALTRMISAIWRRGGPTDFVHEELRQVHSVTLQGWSEGERISSLEALIGSVIARHVSRDSAQAPASVPEPDLPSAGMISTVLVLCPSCGSANVRLVEGCETCGDCGESRCS